MNSHRAFSIIELLVVVAILAVLAAAAMPSYLEARTRSKVVRAAADLTALRTALEAYAVDQQGYPANSGGIGLPGDIYRLESPVAYIRPVPQDVFLNHAVYLYLSSGKIPSKIENPWGRYLVASAGPDALLQTTLSSSILYDPTNGTESAGDIVLSQKNQPPLPAPASNF